MSSLGTSSSGSLLHFKAIFEREGKKKKEVGGSEAELILWPRLALNSRKSSCLGLPSAGIAGVSTKPGFEASFKLQAGLPSPHSNYTFLSPFKEKTEDRDRGNPAKIFFFNDVFVNELRAIRKAGGWDDIFVPIFYSNSRTFPESLVL